MIIYEIMMSSLILSLREAFDRMLIGNGVSKSTVIYVHGRKCNMACEYCYVSGLNRDRDEKED